MKIAQVTATFPPYLGGTGNVCYHNALELVRLGHAVTVFTPALAGSSTLEEMGNIQVVRLSPKLRFGNAALLPQLNHLLQGFDLIHFHYPFFGGEFAARAARRWQIPLVITYHQDVLLKGAMRLVEGFLRHTTSRWLLRSARRVLFTSLDYAAASHARSLLSARAGKTGALANGVDVDFFSPGAASAETAAAFDIQSGDQVVLLVASLDRAHYFKGVEILLEALVSLPATVKCIIAGEGDLRKDYQQCAASQGLSRRLHFPGRVSDAGLLDLYRLADVTVLPSTTMGEAFGLVLLESLACETPVIASNLPGVRSVAADGVDGCLVEPGSVEDLRGKLDWLLGLPPAEREAMGEAGRRKVLADYTWGVIGKRLEGIYRDVCAGN